jgi:hypothetical protein
MWWDRRYMIDTPRVQMAMGFGEDFDLLNVPAGQIPDEAIVTPPTGEQPVRGGK